MCWADTIWELEICLQVHNAVGFIVLDIQFLASDIGSWYLLFILSNGNPLYVYNKKKLIE